MAPRELQEGKLYKICKDENYLPKMGFVIGKYIGTEVSPRMSGGSSIRYIFKILMAENPKYYHAGHRYYVSGGRIDYNIEKL